MDERVVTEPWIKDYDDCDEGPTGWATRFDISNWGLVSAWKDATRIGGAVVAFDTPGLNILERRAVDRGIRRWLVRPDQETQITVRTISSMCS